MTISDTQIKNYLKNHIKRSIINEVGIAIQCYPEHFTEQTGAFGFFAIPRMLFPEIDGLGSYMTGKPNNTATNIGLFINKIMSQVNPKYNGNGGFIAKIYRHGLLHQHEPKIGLYNSRLLGWKFSFNSKLINTNIQEENHLSWTGRNLELNIRQFYEDLLKAIDLFIPLVLTTYRETFIKSYKLQHKPEKLILGDCNFALK